MGVLSRINDIIRSNLNDLLSIAENPEKLLNQAILDMEEYAARARASLVDSVASEKHLDKKRLTEVSAAQRWERRAELALQADDEELARSALLRASDHERQAELLAEQVKVQREYVGALKQSMVLLDQRLLDARSRKDALVARAKAARARKRIATQLYPQVGKSGSKEARAFDTFERMEDRVLELEAQVEAYTEIGQLAEVKTDQALEQHFVAIEREGDITARLSKLRLQIATTQPAK